MDINKFHEITNDIRTPKERLIELKDKMLHFLHDPLLESGIDVMFLCISLTNDYLYCSKHIKIQYTKPIEADKETIARFKYDWCSFYHEQLLDERAYRFYCNWWFELVARVLFGMSISEKGIEEAYFSKVNGLCQLTLF